MKRSPRSGFAILLSVLTVLATALGACSAPSEDEQSPPSADATVRQTDSSQTVAGTEATEAPASSEGRPNRPTPVVEPTTPPALGAAAHDAAEPTSTVQDAAVPQQVAPSQRGAAPQQGAMPKSGASGSVPGNGNGMAMPVPTATPKPLRPTLAVTFVVSNTMGRGMTIRSTPASRDPGKVWPDGTRMYGLGAEQDANGWTWRWVRDPDGTTGWMPSNYLVQDDSGEAVAATASSAPPSGATPTAGTTAQGGLSAPSAPPTLIIVPEIVPPAPTSTAPTSAPAVAKKTANVDPGSPGAGAVPTVTGNPAGSLAESAPQLPPATTKLAPGAAPSVPSASNSPAGLPGAIPNLTGAGSSLPAAATNLAGAMPGQPVAAAPAAVQAAATSPQQAAAPTQAQPLSWAVAFDKIEPVDVRVVASEGGATRPQLASGQYEQVYFRIQNRQKQPGPMSSSTFSLTDAQGRTYTSNFEVRQIQADGGSASYSGANVAPGGTVALYLTFDVATDATGLVLHTKGGNDVKVE